MDKKRRQLIYLPLEPLEERYTKQWYDWIPQEFDNASSWDTTHIITGNRLTNTIQTGTFLDLYSSMYWFYEQLRKLTKYLYDDNKHLYTYSNNNSTQKIIFIPDIEMWGVEGIRYLINLGKIPNAYLVGFLHAASYTKEDFMEPMAYIGKHSECAWIEAMDLVFLGSDYHKQKVLEARPSVNPDKLVVTGNPFCTKDVIGPRGLKPTETRKYDVVISDRPDYEKRVHETMLALLPAVEKHNIKVAITTSREVYSSSTGFIGDLAKLLSNKFPNNYYLFEGLSKEEYYDIVSDSKTFVTCTIEEIPVVPRKFSFNEHLQTRHKWSYDTFDFSYCFYDTTGDISDKVIGVRESCKDVSGISWRSLYSALSKRAEIFDKSVKRMRTRIEDIL